MIKKIICYIDVPCDVFIKIILTVIQLIHPGWIICPGKTDFIQRLMGYCQGIKTSYIENIIMMYDWR